MRAVVRENVRVLTGYHRLEIEAKGIGRRAVPGRFYMLRVFEGGTDPLLRRPLSLHRHISDDRVAFLYREAGKGTRLLSMLVPGDELDALGPLGNGFTVPPGLKRALLVAGGIGVAPLVALGEELINKRPDVEIAAFIGGRAEGDVLAVHEFRELGVRTYICTEDGSLAKCGVVTETLGEYVSHFGGSIDSGWRAYSCGPKGMMEAVSGVCEDNGIRGEVSLETHMACGIGACMGCVTGIRSGGKEGYGLVCKDGPVFDSTDVIW